ncbi:hypothetical protein AYO21_07482 [Fonsecaea monophora]|uniref:Major facilitator superfamily (MFS) profile domain-containing protein n=1 Tax=Fonsecaea monophora TaxID=254056 RepID=A0A177F4U5_9EURO|nr:hypothetical protein AYO21_07482 [Fonsecaea monophora]KAH0846392.1 maltose permease MAL61 [Fonsecaea pedrosoi]OAG38362.1 hypothetical protein AYO21_07482 [Fonsecaea monophora]
MATKDILDGAAETHVEAPYSAVMAPDASNEMSLTIMETIQANKKYIGWCLLLSIGPMVYGFDLIIVSLATAMPAFRMVFGSEVGQVYIVPSIWLALWNSMIQVGAMAGAFSSGTISDRFGRKVTFTLGAIIGNVAILVVYLADRPDSLQSKRVMFLMGKIIVGLAIGLLNTAYLTMISEIAPARIRGPLLSNFTFFAILSQVAAVSIVIGEVRHLTADAFRVVFASQWARTAVALIVGVLVPESPTRLAALQTVVEHEIIAERNADSWSYTKCFRGTNWRRTRIVIYANILQQFVGLAMIQSSTYFLQLAGMSAYLTLELSLIHLVIGLPMLLASYFLMTRLGRRTLFLWGAASVGILWTAFGIAGCFSHSKSATLFLGVELIIIYEAFVLGIGAVYPVISAEASSVHLRAASQAIGIVAQFIAAWAFQFTVPYMYNTDSGDLGGKTGFIFAFLSATAFGSKFPRRRIVRGPNWTRCLRRGSQHGSSEIMFALV